MTAREHGTTHSRRAAARPALAALLAALVASVALGAALGLAACGGDEPADGAPSPPAAPATARDALVAYLGMLERAQFGDLDRVATPRYVSNHGGGGDSALREVRLVELTLEPEASGERTQARMTVYIDPGPGKGVWGDEAGERLLFASLVRGDGGGWLIDDFGTGP